MSGLNIRSFAKVEPLNDEDRSENQHGRNEMQPVASQQDSDDSDAGIQYLAPDETPCGKPSIPLFGLEFWLIYMWISKDNNIIISNLNFWQTLHL